MVLHYSPMENHFLGTIVETMVETMLLNGSYIRSGDLT